jgi:serine protease Do
MSKPWHIALTLTLLILMLGGTLSRAQQDDRSYLGTRTSINNGKTVIVEVVPGSPAAAAGLQPNDVILAVGSDLITAERPLETLLANYRPDDGVQLSISRGGQPLTIGVILGKRPAVATSAGTNSATNSVTAAPPSAVPTL